MKIINNILWCVASLAVLTACTEEDYKLYDTSQKDSVFFELRNSANEQIDEVVYAFNFDIAQVHTVEIPVTLMGVPKEYDRTIKINVIADESDMVEGKNYTITNNIIPANQVNGNVHINLLRDLDTEIQHKEKSLKLTIDENDDLKSVGENFITIRYSDIRPEITPEWWPSSEMPEYTFENAQLFFQFFYEYAPKADMNLYNEIIGRYGDYFVNARRVQGPFAMYTKFLRNYVCIPFYRAHPELEWQSSPEW